MLPMPSSYADATVPAGNPVWDPPACKGELVRATGFMGAAALNASKLWASVRGQSTACGMPPPVPPGLFPDNSTVYMPRMDDVGRRRPNNWGGLNEDVNPQPYYDPRSLTLRAPTGQFALSAEVPGGAMDALGPLQSAITLPHGPSAFTYTAADVRPKTQFAPQGELFGEPMVLDAMPPKTPCECGCAYGWSMAYALLQPQNVQKVRRLLEKTGMVIVTPALKKVRASRGNCACAILSEVYPGFYAFAQQYQDVPTIKVPDVSAYLAMLNQLYVTDAIAAVRSIVAKRAINNYARAEGNRAGLQAMPLPDCLYPCEPARLPEILPGTGLTVPLDTSAFAVQGLCNAPTATIANRMALQAVSGIPMFSNER